MKRSDTYEHSILVESPHSGREFSIPVRYEPVYETLDSGEQDVVDFDLIVDEPHMTPAQRKFMRYVYEHEVDYTE